MSIHIGILFLILAVVPDSHERPNLGAVLLRHRGMARDGRGLCTYSFEFSGIVELTLTDLLESYVMVENCLIGISKFGKLRPVFDLQDRHVIAHYPNLTNTVLSRNDIIQMPYNANYLPTRDIETSVPPLQWNEINRLACPNNPFRLTGPADRLSRPNSFNYHHGSN